MRAGNSHGQDQGAAHHVIDTLEHLTIDLADAVAQAAGAGYGGASA